MGEASMTTQFSLQPRDYRPIDSWPFGWRFVDTDRIEIPRPDLDRIRPLSEAASRSAWDHAAVLHGSGYRNRFTETDGFEVNGRWSAELEDPVTAWLEEVIPPTNAPLFLSWTERMAVETVRDVFVRHWSAFCYPVEDLVAWPRHEAWVLAFDYKQRFYFAVSRGAQGLP
jgi:hypothetical protein